MIKIFIVDDHEIIRESLKNILKDEVDLMVVGEAQSGDEVLQNIKNIDCDIMLLDFYMPGRSGLDLISDLKRLNLNMHILVLSINPEDLFVLNMLKTGASGYVCKNTALKELLFAIRKVYSCGRYLSTSLAEQLVFDYAPDKTEHLFGNSFSNRSLSDKEQNILYLLASGKKAKEIAVDLKISVSTVFSHRKHILIKLKLKSDVDLMHYAIEHKIIN
jgi:two-component system, NarL family, invasion response regulator UvrY